MVRFMCVLVGVLILRVSIAQILEEAFGEQSLRCKMRCKFGLSGGTVLSVGKNENNKGAAYATQKCFCFGQKGKNRETRSTNGANETDVDEENRDISDNQIIETKINGPIACEDYFNSKKEEHNKTQDGLVPGYVDINSINVTFVKRGHWLAYVTWDPPKKKIDALKKYLILFSDEKEQSTFCQEISKHQAHKVINGSYNFWKYPHTLQIAVIGLPYRGPPGIDMRGFSPTAIPEILPFSSMRKLETKKQEDNSKQYLTIILVVSVFICMMLVVLGVFYRRKRTPTGHVSSPMIQVQSASKPQNNDIYFASYLPENEKFSHDMATIAYNLGIMGYKVVFDQVDSVHMNEIGFNMWVDKQILEAKKYIVFCSPGYVRLWQSLATSAMDNNLSHLNKEDLVRVRYEIKRISDIYSENCSTSRIVCIKMDPKMTTRQLPPWMNHNMLLWPEQKEDVIRRLNDQAAMVMNM